MGKMIRNWITPISSESSVSVLDECDGIIIATPECYEPEAVTGIREWFAETSRQIFAVGPLLPVSGSSSALLGESQLSANAADIQNFMDTTERSHGKGSMLYVRLS